MVSTRLSARVKLDAEWGVASTLEQLGRLTILGPTGLGQAEPLVDRVAEELSTLGVAHVATGRFGARMEVELVNDGPVTIVLNV